ncbi:MAG: NAD-dependent epimerase/dehydratase family protein [Vicinamibacterales bacterium]
MRVFVAGGSGTIGRLLVRALVEAGHAVHALTRRPDRTAELRTIGATAVVADALDPVALSRAVQSAHPTCVIHQLTALPVEGPRRASDLEPTNRLRTDGTRHLLDAAVAVGARRFIAASFAPFSSDAFASNAAVADGVAATRCMEEQVVRATLQQRIDGVILRYGLFYGAAAPSTTAMLDLVRRRRLPVVRHDTGLLPFIHIEDAVRATMAAMERGEPGCCYNIVDDRAASMAEVVTLLARYAGAPPPLRVPMWIPRLVAPYLAQMTSARVVLSNADAKRDLQWAPRYPTLEDGLPDTVRALTTGVAA